MDCIGLCIFVERNSNRIERVPKLGEQLAYLLRRKLRGHHLDFEEDTLLKVCAADELVSDKRSSDKTSVF